MLFQPGVDRHSAISHDKVRLSVQDYTVIFPDSTFRPQISSISSAGVT